DRAPQTRVLGRLNFGLRILDFGLRRENAGRDASPSPLPFQSKIQNPSRTGPPRGRRARRCRRACPAAARADMAPTRTANRNDFFFTATADRSGRTRRPGLSTFLSRCRPAEQSCAPVLPPTPPPAFRCPP